MASHTHQELLNYTNLKARALKVPELDPGHGVSGTRLIFFLFLPLFAKPLIQFCWKTLIGISTKFSMKIDVFKEGLGKITIGGENQFKWSPNRASWMPGSTL